MDEAQVAFLKEALPVTCIVCMLDCETVRHTVTRVCRYCAKRAARKAVGL